MFINDLLDNSKWNDFLEYKLSKDFISKKEKELFYEFIKNRKYEEICTKIIAGTYIFSIPKKHLISKGHSTKKRTIYTFNDDEMIILKYISYLLYDYDYLFSPNVYSFRKNTSVKTAIRNISNIQNINKMHGYKVDIKNYFNSIDVNILLKNLKNDIKDEKLYILISDILLNESVEFNGKIIKELKGVMAGTPISAFLANYYIKEIDEFFWNEKVVYSRYADDIILFCNTKNELIESQKLLKEFFDRYNLEVNPEKEYFFNPSDRWEFLGFSFDNKTIDLSDNSVRKIKAKIRRSARGIRRWMTKRNLDYTLAIKAMTRKFNKKFFGKQDKEELSWKYWFFPTINTTKSLKIIDNYMQEQLRYIATGKHNKRNFKKVPYSVLKSCGYKSLVHEYYAMLSLNMKNNS